MKILLLNDNPVVNKLVTLSAQKTSDELEVVASIDEILSDTYDLLVVDDNMYNDSLFDDIKEKATFSQSLYICSRDADQVEEFSSSIKKPFLPTDLVELFSVISRDIDTVDLSLQEEEPTIEEDELEEEEIEEEISLDELELNDDEELILDEDELELDEDLSLNTEINESVLDHEEAQKVKDLLDETSEELEEDDEPIEEELKLEEKELDLEPEEELELDEEELELDEEELELDEELELEDQIKAAVNELSEEDLNSEVNEKTLLDIASNEINSLDALTSKDLKIAIGEEVEETKEEVTVETKVKNEEPQTQTDTANNGVKALKKLLEALMDKDVAASMKGMKISINITLGDN